MYDFNLDFEGCVEYDGIYYEDDSFTNCVGIKDSKVIVKLHPNTKKIEMHSFKYRSIIKIILPEGLEQIETNAFLNCDCLKEVNFPSTLKYIGEAAFKGTSLRAVDLSKCIDLKLSEDSFKNVPFRELYLPATLKEIPPGCFASNFITSLTLPNQLETIGANAFENCTYLGSIDLSSVKNLGKRAF